MKNFSGSNGSVIDDLKGKNVNCILHSFKGGEMFNISSIDLSKHLRTSDNETFTCLAPWPNGTPEFRPQGTHVKCMPQNGKVSNVLSVEYLILVLLLFTFNFDFIFAPLTVSKKAPQKLKYFAFRMVQLCCVCLLHAKFPSLSLSGDNVIKISFLFQTEKL